MATMIHRFKPGQDITCHAGADITGCTLVAISDAPTDGNPTVSPAGAGARAFGVAVTDRARGEKVLVTREGVVELIAGGAIVAGDDVSAAAGGRAVRATDGVVVGIAVTDAASGELVQVAL